MALDDVVDDVADGLARRVDDATVGELRENAGKMNADAHDEWGIEGEWCVLRTSWQTCLTITS